MRLYSTLQREKVDLPPPPGPIRMYFCGPTVYARAHVGNARPFVVGMWLRNWLRTRGYDTTLVHNITDINDKIYAAAGDGSSGELAAKATRSRPVSTRATRRSSSAADGERSVPASVTTTAPGSTRPRSTSA